MMYINIGTMALSMCFRAHLHDKITDLHCYIMIFDIIIMVAPRHGRNTVRKVQLPADLIEFFIYLKIYKLVALSRICDIFGVNGYSARRVRGDRGTIVVLATVLASFLI